MGQNIEIKERIKEQRAASPRDNKSKLRNPDLVDTSSYTQALSTSVDHKPKARSLKHTGRRLDVQARYANRLRNNDSTNQALKLKQCFDTTTATRVCTAELFYAQSAIVSTGILYCQAT